MSSSLYWILCWIATGNVGGKLDQSASDSDECNNSSNTQKPTKIQTSFSMESVPSDYLRFGQPTMVWFYNLLQRAYMTWQNNDMAK